jgi:hypothetical protein
VTRPETLATAGEAALGAAGTVLLVALLWWPFTVALVAGAWHVLAKAGRRGWTCLVPLYNVVQFLRIAKMSGWWAPVALVPPLNVALFVLVSRRLALAFGQAPRFAAGLVLLPPVYLAILGLGEARYRRFDVVENAVGAGRELAPAGVPAQRWLHVVPRSLAAG